MSSFETGVKLFKNLLLRRKTSEAFFANEEDALHKAFPAKATVHSGPFGIPMLWSAARSYLEKKSTEPRQTDALAYVHIPFCESRCLFCMFYQNPWTPEASARYTRNLIKEFQLWADRPAQNSKPIKALYFGGGTPTALPADELKAILTAARQYLPLSDDCEITVEGRIHNLTDEKFDVCLEAGVNRFSLGVQSFSDSIRKEMQRIDSSEAVINRLTEFAKNPQAAIVIDLLYGFPGQMGEAWEHDLKVASELPIDGVDCYQLNVFEKSPLNKRIEAGLISRAATLAEAADMFARSVEIFSQHGAWRRLTNTHWARTDRERNYYNSHAKGSMDCLPFGCGAGGKLSGHSWMQERKLAKWTEMIEKNQKPVFVMMKPQENWFLLRSLSSAVESGPFNLKELGAHYGIDIETPLKPVTDQWQRAGLLEKSGDVFIPTVAGQFWYVTTAQLLTEALTAAISKNGGHPEDLISQSVYSPNQGDAWLNGVPRK